MNLKELREKNKLTQAAFAAPLGVSGKDAGTVYRCIS